jgi:formylmethanofuran dehydrogenase subunit E
MGNQAKVSKERKCKSCGEIFHWSAKSLQEHAIFCQRLKDINLLMAESNDERIIRI